MTRLDPAVRDLLVAVHNALDAAELRDYPVCAAQTAIRSAVQYPQLGLPTDWLLTELGEMADAKRVRVADRWDAYQATREMPA
jgi:hypothetical protein